MQNDLGKLSELLSSAREHALDGDYYSAQTEYEEFKSQIEKRGSHLRVPSIKRVRILTKFVLLNRFMIQHPRN